MDYGPVSRGVPTNRNAHVMGYFQSKSMLDDPYFRIKQEELKHPRRDFLMVTPSFNMIEEKINTKKYLSKENRVLWKTQIAKENEENALKGKSSNTKFQGRKKITSFGSTIYKTSKRQDLQAGRPRQFRSLLDSFTKSVPTNSRPPMSSIEPFRTLYQIRKQHAFQNVYLHYHDSGRLKIKYCAVDENNQKVQKTSSDNLGSDSRISIFKQSKSSTRNPPMNRKNDVQKRCDDCFLPPIKSSAAKKRESMRVLLGQHKKDNPTSTRSKRTACEKPIKKTSAKLPSLRREKPLEEVDILAWKVLRRPTEVFPPIFYDSSQTACENNLMARSASDIL